MPINVLARNFFKEWGWGGGGGRNLRSNKKCIVEWAVCSMSFGHLYKGDRLD